MMKELGFEQYGSDMCLFKHKENRALVVLYVDDLLISAEDDITIEAIAKELGERYMLMSVYRLLFCLRVPVCGWGGLAESSRALVYWQSGTSHPLFTHTRIG